MQIDSDSLSKFSPQSLWHSKKRGIVLLDDDPQFCLLFVSIARSLGLEIQSFESLAKLPSIRHLNEYDIAIFDYHLDKFRGTELAEYVEDFFPSLPVFLISSDERARADQKWPLSIAGFYNKSLGPEKIIKNILTENMRLHLYKEYRR